MTPVQRVGLAGNRRISPVAEGLVPRFRCQAGS